MSSLNGSRREHETSVRVMDRTVQFGKHMHDLDSMTHDMTALKGSNDVATC